MTLKKLLNAIEMQDAEATRYFLATLPPAEITRFRTEDSHQDTLLHKVVRQAKETKDLTLLKIVLENPSVRTLLATKNYTSVIPAELVIADKVELLPILLCLIEHAEPGSPWLSQSLLYNRGFRWGYYAPYDDWEFITTYKLPLLPFSVSIHSEELMTALLAKKAEQIAPWPEIYALTWAIAQSHISMVQILLNAGAPVRRMELVGAKTLLKRAYGEAVAISTALLEAITSVDDNYHPLYSPLVIACDIENKSLIKKFIAMTPVATFMVNDGNNLLHYLCSKGLVDALAEVLESCVPEQLSVLFKQLNDKGETPLYLACLCTHEEKRRRMVKLLLTHGSACVINQCAKGKGALNIPSIYTDNSLVQLCLDNGADPSQGNGDNMPLVALFRRGNGDIDILQQLVRSGIEPSRYLEQNTSLCYPHIQIAKTKTLFHWQIFCESVSAHKLHALLSYSTDNGRTGEELAAKNPAMQFGLQRANGFNKLLKQHACIFSIINYLIAKSKESGDRYQQRHTHFACLLRSLELIIEDGQRFSTQAHGIIANLPNFDTKGFSIGSWQVTKSEDRYRALLEELGGISLTVLRQRLKELLLYIQNATQSTCETAEWEVLKELRRKMQTAKLIEPLPAAPINYSIDEIAFAIQIQDHCQLGFLLAGVNNEHPLWQGLTGTNSINLVHLAVKCAIESRQNETLSLLLTRLHEINPQQFSVLWQQKNEKDQTVLTLLSELKKPRSAALNSVILAAAVNTSTFIDDWMNIGSEDEALANYEIAFNKNIYPAITWERLLLTALLIKQRFKIADFLLEKQVKIELKLITKLGNQDMPREGIHKMLQNVPAEQVNVPIATKNDTPLLVACRLNQEDVAQELLNKGAQANTANTDGYTPLHEAIKSGMRAPFCQELIESMPAADRSLFVNYATGSEQLTPLHIACVRQEKRPGDALNIVAMLAKFNIALIVNKVNAEGNSALHLACNQNNQGLIEFLVKELKANVHITNDSRLTAIGIVAKKALKDDNYIPTLEMLLTLGARNISDKNTSVLEWACEKGHWALLRKLLALPNAQAMVKNHDIVKLIAIKGFPEDIMRQLLVHDFTIDANALLGIDSNNARLLYQYLNTDTPLATAKRKQLVSGLTAPSFRNDSIMQTLQRYATYNFRAFSEFCTLFLKEGKSIPNEKEIGCRIANSEYFLPHLSFLCTHLSAQTLTFIARNSASAAKPLLETALCFDKIHHYLAQKSEKTGEEEMRRYQERLGEFAQLLVDLRGLIHSDNPDGMRELVLQRIQQIPEMERRTVSFLGGKLSTSQERYRHLRQALGDVDEVMLYHRLTHYLTYLDTALQQTDITESERKMVTELIAKMGTLQPSVCRIVADDVPQSLASDATVASTRSATVPAGSPS